MSLLGKFLTSRKNASGSQRSIITRIGKRDFSVTSDDKYLDHIQGEFEPNMVKIFESLVKDEDIVLDVGANIGCTSLLFGQLGKRVFSFEPSPSTFSLLCANLANGEMHNVTPVNLGLGRENSTLQLTFSSDNRAGGFVSNQIVASAGHQIEDISIVAGDKWLNEAKIDRVDFIKIDVEGFEKNVIEGLSETLTTSKPIVVLELNHWCLNAFQRTSVPDFFDFLRSRFPILLAVDNPSDIRDLHNSDDAYHVMYHHIVNGFRYANLIGAFDRAQLSGLARNA